MEIQVFLFCFFPAVSNFAVSPHSKRSERIFFLDAVMQDHTGRARVFHYYFLPCQLFEAFTGNHKFKTVVCFLNAAFRNNTEEKNM